MTVKPWSGVEHVHFFSVFSRWCARQSFWPLCTAVGPSLVGSVNGEFSMWSFSQRVADTVHIGNRQVASLPSR